MTDSTPDTAATEKAAYGAVDTMFEVARPQKSAVVSEDGVYRYHLTRTWNAGAPHLAWLMLNPSTADADVDDPTIRRCMRFARDWVYGGIEVVNLFAYRATKPADLERCPVDVVGPDNYGWIRQTADRCPVFVLAWGAHKQATPLAVGNALAAIGGRSTLYQLGATQSGQPRHPLYVKADVIAQPYPKTSTTGHLDVGT